MSDPSGIIHTQRVTKEIGLMVNGLAVNAEETARAAWLEKRRHHITATDVPKILGLSKWGGPTSVYLDKVPDPDAPAPEFGAKRMEGMTWGRRLEEAIIAAFSERTQRNVYLADPHSLVECEATPLLACSLDAWIAETNEPVDAKNIRNLDPAVWGEDGSSDIPDQYALQLAVQMACTKTRVAYLPVLFFGQELRIFHVEHDPEVESMVMEAAHDFWTRYVVPRIPPPPDGSSAYTEHLSRALRQKTQDLVPVSDETTLMWAEALREARAEEAAAAAIREEAEQNLKERIGEHAGLLGPGFRITWKQAKGTPKTDWESVARELGMAYPETFGVLVKMHTKEVPGSRRFTPKFTSTEE
jgi:putative phage-type endonuclease